MLNGEDGSSIID